MKSPTFEHIPDRRENRAEAGCKGSAKSVIALRDGHVMIADEPPGHHLKTLLAICLLGILAGCADKFWVTPTNRADLLRNIYILAIEAIVAAAFGTWIIRKTIMALKTGEIRGKAGIARRASSPGMFWANVFIHCVMSLIPVVILVVAIGNLVLDLKKLM